jgi:hypothetical protein
LIAVPKLTKAQAFALFYRFVRYVSWSYKTEWGERPWKDLNPHRGSSYDEFRDEDEGDDVV